MNILLIDKALPSSVYSGKTVHLKNIYGELASRHKIIFLRTTPAGQVAEAEELEAWAKETFKECLRLPALPRPVLKDRLKTIAMFRPWYDLFLKHPAEIPALRARLYDIARHYDIDCVLTHDHEIAQYGWLLSEDYPWYQDLADSLILQIRRQLKKTRSISKKMALWWRYMREAAFEEEIVCKAQITAFVAEDDASLYRSKTNRKLLVVANGVDSNYFDRAKVERLKEQKPYVIFTGHMNFAPNCDAATYFTKEIYPTLKVKYPELGFKVVGADPLPVIRDLAKDPNIEVTGRVEDIRPYLASAVAFVCPMRMGSGIKNKIIEAMSMELPVIASDLAVKGIPGIPDDMIRVASSADDYVRGVTEYLKDNDQRNEIGKRSREFVQSHFGWENVVKQYEAAYLECLVLEEAKQ